MKEAFDTKRFVIRERFKFWSCMDRKAGELIQEFVTRIRQEVAACDFSSLKDPLDEAVTTKFMCSVNNEAILKSLLNMKSSDITFNRAVEIAMEATKAAKETVNEPQVETEKETINKIRAHYQNESTTKVKVVKVWFKKSSNKRIAPSRNFIANSARIVDIWKLSATKKRRCNFCKNEGHIELKCQSEFLLLLKTQQH